MSSTVHDREQLLDLLQHYFNSLYRGDVERLRQIFHPRARLFGEVKGEVLLRDLEPYLQAVATRASPQQNGEAQRMEVLALRVDGSIALATTRCKMLGLNYLDQLSLLKQDGRWFIVSKLYTDLRPQPGP